MKIKPVFFVIGALAWAGNAYSAIVNVYGDAASYSAATGSTLFLIDFNGSPNTYVAGNSISADATFGSPEASDPTLVNWSSDALADAGSTLVSNFVGPLSIDFTDPSIFAFSLDFLSSGSLETIELYDSSNTMFSSVVALNPGGFFGLVSDTAIDRVVIRNGIFTGGGRDRFFIDNLAVNAVPVPAAVWLFGSGLVGLMGMARRKKV